MFDPLRHHGLPSAVPPRLPGPILLRQTWRQVTFLHWRVAPAAVRHLFPEGCQPDVLDGRTYAGLVAFRVTASRLGGAVPLGGFGEVNVRLYSRDRHGRQGVVFLSLDVDRPDVAGVGRGMLGLPYHWSRIRCGWHGGDIAVACRRRRAGNGGATGAGATSRWLVRPGEPVDRPTPLEVFLTARWGLHLRRLGRTWWLPVAHEPWRLHRGRLRRMHDELLPAAGVPVDSASVPSVLCCPLARARLGRPVPVW